MALNVNGVMAAFEPQRRQAITSDLIVGASQKRTSRHDREAQCDDVLSWSAIGGIAADTLQRTGSGYINRYDGLPSLRAAN
ncbi:hypothetical protein [Hyphomicrobium sp.]|uniref:hypothetical protein n=1 Tax=Hyphomicrobium sp. TaxID=82 RepID=UPI0025C60DF0|nr:hypothetical protein [Hyphomicrobium sp.]MCC7251930.1 hypothetical protein [Hyphomicrobium sp.]